VAALKVALDGLLQEFHRAVANSARVADGDGRLKAFPAEQAPVVWIGLVRFHARRTSERTTLRSNGRSADRNMRDRKINRNPIFLPSYFSVSFSRLVAALPRGRRKT
jgi:hypothetical protein